MCGFLSRSVTRKLRRLFLFAMSTSSDAMGTQVTSSELKGHQWDPPDIQHLVRHGGNTVAYRKTLGKSPGVLFLPGFMSNMNGGKAIALERYCQQAGLSYIRFDYQGLGESLGSLKPGVKPFNVWKSDALAVLDQLTSGPQILVGSSMGGALMLLLSMERPERVQALIGVATVVNFTNPLWYTSNTDAKTARIVAESPTEQASYTTPKDFVEEPEQRHLIEDTFHLNCPIRLLHGMRDTVVSYMNSLEVARRVTSTDVDVMLRKDGDHRLSKEGDLLLLTQTMHTLVAHLRNTSSSPQPSSPGFKL